MTQIVEQNNVLINKQDSKQDYIIEILEALVEDSAEDPTENEVDELYRTLD